MLRFKAPTKTLTAIMLAAFVLAPQPILASGTESMSVESLEMEPPPTLEDIQGIERENVAMGDTGLPLEIRLDALKEAAVSYGARAGLAARTFEIRKQIDSRSRHLDKVYDFGKLLVPAPSGLLIEPPVVSEAENNMLIDFDGQEAAVSDRIYHIINNARIVSAPRNWRGYLEREWGAVEAPPDILRPEDDEEREVWNDYTEKGWEQGVLQANEIFEEDLNLLNADFQGMVRYRMLLSQGMISPPHALQVDRGITGDGDEMRVGDRAVKITGVPELMTGFDEWRPASR
jgi:defect-in-organelle-trafficking protein DotC